MNARQESDTDSGWMLSDVSTLTLGAAFGCKGTLSDIFFDDLLSLLPDPTLPDCPLLMLPFSLPFPPAVSLNLTGFRSPRSSSFIMSGDETCIVPVCGSGFLFHGESRCGVVVPVGVNPSDVCG